MRTGHVYILKCSDVSFYVGVTNDVMHRVSQHQNGETKGYTHTRRPVKLVWDSGEIPILDAIALEKQIKGWRRDKKIALINNEWERLPELAQPYWKRVGKE